MPVPTIRAAGPAALALALPFAPAALAQAPSADGLSGGIDLGVGLAPDYEGSDDYAPIPFGRFELDYGGFALRSRGLGVQFDLLPDPDWSAGPVVAYSGGRDDVEDAAVDRLPEVDAGIEVGAFLSYQLPLGLVPRDGVSFEVALQREVAGGHGGLIGAGSIGYSASLGDRFRLSGAVSASVVDDSYADAFFDVDAAGAAASGLPAFDADGGLKDVGLSLAASYSISESWVVGGFAGYSRLVGDAADSPIVEDRGSPDQLILGLTAGYRF